MHSFPHVVCDLCPHFPPAKTSASGRRKCTSDRRRKAPSDGLANAPVGTLPTLTSPLCMVARPYRDMLLIDDIRPGATPRAHFLSKYGLRKGAFASPPHPKPPHK